MTTTNFQNNFTTVEQSKRLLELGISADSADMFRAFLSNAWTLPHQIHRGKLYNDEIKTYAHIIEATDYVPCWSAGQLLKICFICGGEKFIKDSTSMLKSFIGASLSRRIDEMTETIVRFMEDRDDIFDFTQLNN